MPPDTVIPEQAVDKNKWTAQAGLLVMQRNTLNFHIGMLGIPGLNLLSRQARRRTSTAGQDEGDRQEYACACM